MSRSWLTNIREKQRLTHQEVADGSDIERAYYTQIELGKRNPSVSVAKRIAAKMEFNWTLFFEDECREKRQKINENYPTPKPPAA